MPHAAITATGVTIRRDSSEIIHDTSFTIAAGSLTGLIGPSGSGKTTLMRAIVGVQMVTSGTLEVLGQAAGTAVLRSKVGYVSQSPAIYEDLTVRQNLDYFAVMSGSSKNRVPEVLELVDLAAQANQLASKLSGGQRARVSLAIALVAEPDLLVLDEPTVGLDPVLRRDLWQLFHALAKAGKTLLISSHVMDEAEQCDAILLLRDGTLLSHSSRAELLARTKTSDVETAFLQLVEGKDHV